MLKKILFVVVVCFCSLAFARECPSTERTLDCAWVKYDDIAVANQGVRDELWRALRNGNVAAVDSALEILSQQVIPESALDSLELLQINILLKRYDLAFPQFVNMLKKSDEKVRYSFADDSLLAYLREQTHVGMHEHNRPEEDLRLDRILRINSFLENSEQADIKQEFKDLSHILQSLTPMFEIVDKKYWIYIMGMLRETEISKDTIANIVDKRVWRHLDFHSEWDTLRIDSALKETEVFCEKYPESEYSDWLKNITSKLRIEQERYKDYRNYYESKLYTGGIGIEAFVGSGAGILLGAPVQISRLIVTPYLNLDDLYDDFFVTAGLDVFETKHFKFQPFLGGNGPDFITAGLQGEFRFWMSKTPGPGFRDASYLSLKLKYMAIRSSEGSVDVISPETNSVVCVNYSSDEKSWSHKFFIGLGLHIW